MQPKRESESAKKPRKGDDPQEMKTPSLPKLKQEASVQTLADIRIQQPENEKEGPRPKLWKYRRKPSEIASYALLLLGAIALTLSIVYSSIIPAFVGLGLAFWGALLLYIKPTRYVKAALLDSTATSSLTTINNIITELDYEGKGIYLPPRYLREVKAGTVFIPSKEEIIIPPVEEATGEKVFLKNPNGICLTPPGLSLTNLYEDTLGRDFIEVDLDYLRDNLPQLFIEGLEIAEDLELDVQSNIVNVKIVGSIYGDLCRELKNTSSNVCSSFGCPLCSSIALALARSTGKPIVIEKTDQSEDGKTIETHYRIIEEREDQS